MTENKKRKVWEDIKQKGFEMELSKDLIFLVESHFDRFEFIKDYLGIRDMIFVAEPGSRDYLKNFFVSFDQDVSPKMTYEEKEEKWYEKLETRELIALNELETVLSETNRKVGFAYGYQQSAFFDEEIVEREVRAHYAFKKPVNRAEIERYARIFPEEYLEIAKMPEEVFYIPKSVEKEFMKINKDRIIRLKDVVDDILIEQPNGTLKEFSINLEAFVEN